MAAHFSFSADDLRRAAGQVSYSRGLGYLERVEDLEIAGSWVTATVFGNEAYEVRLRLGAPGGDLRGECSCPFGAEGNFCKHCVAAGLAALERVSALSERAAAAAAPDPEPGSVASWLNSLSRDELLTELRELLIDEPELILRFEIRAAAWRAADGAEEQQVENA